MRNKVLIYYEIFEYAGIYVSTENQKQWKSYSTMPNLLTNCCLQIDFLKVVKHTGGKWLVDATKHCKTISCKAHYSPVDYLDIKEPDGTCSITYSRRSSDGNILGGEPLQNQNNQVPESPPWIKKNGHGHIQPNHSHSYHDEIRRYWQLETTMITPMKNWLKYGSCWTNWRGQKILPPTKFLNAFMSFRLTVVDSSHVKMRSCDDLL